MANAGLVLLCEHDCFRAVPLVLFLSIVVEHSPQRGGVDGLGLCHSDRNKEKWHQLAADTVVTPLVIELKSLQFPSLVKGLAYSLSLKSLIRDPRLLLLGA